MSVVHAAPSERCECGVREVLRRKQLRSGLVAVLGVTGAVVFGLPHGGSKWLRFLSPVFAGIGIHGFVAAQRCLAMIELGADVIAHAHRLIVRAGDLERSIDLDMDRIDTARKYSVPLSTARTRAGRSGS